MRASWVLPGLVRGFLAGLFAFRVNSCWCPECGQTTVALAEQHYRDGAVK